MEVRPTHASLAAVIKSREGAMVMIEDDVQNVANDLRDIDPHLRLRYSEAGEYFVVYWKPDDEDEGCGDLITTAVEIDQRIVKDVREIYHRCSQPGYSFADEHERREDEAKRERDHALREANGELYERLAHAMRKDLGATNRAFIPADVPPG